MKSWSSIDKSEWNLRGEWDNEPDKVHWIDDKTGLDCLIVRQIGHGALCGYVGVPESHPLFEKNYDEAESEVGYFDVHGGLTFADRCHHTANPERSICHDREIAANTVVWWLGFDCAHGGDICPAYYGNIKFNRDNDTYKTIEFVRSQVEGLASQIKEVVSL